MSLMLLGHAYRNPITFQMAGGRCGGPFPRPAPGAAEEFPGSRRDVLNAERDGGFEGYSTEMEIITQAGAWLLLGRAARTTLPIPYGTTPPTSHSQQRDTLLYS